MRLPGRVGSIDKVCIVGRAGIVAVTALTLGAVAASSALATAPEYGRCIRKASRVGAGFADSKCTHSTASKARYEWIPGPGPDAGFTLKEKSVYSTRYHDCQKALFEEALASKERAEAAEPTTSPERKVELIEKAEGHELASSDAYTEAGMDKSECETRIETESAKAPAAIETAPGVGRHALRVSCGEVSGAGEYSGAKSVANLTIEFSECALKGGPLKGVACQSPLAGEGEIDTSTLSGELGIVSVEEGNIIKNAGIAISPAEGVPFAEFNCGAMTFVVTGSAIREVQVNKMQSFETRGFSQSAGKQKVEAFIGQAPDVLETSIEGGADIQTGLSLKAMQKNADNETIEVNTTV